MTLSTLTGTATTTVKVGDFNALIAALNAELASLTERIGSFEAQLGGRLTVLEARPEPVIPPDLTDRVLALENLVVRSPAENPNPLTAFERTSRPPGIDPDKVELVYDRATLYYGNIEMYADRIGDNRWRLYAQLNFIVISPAQWTYDEIFEGTVDEVYAHAVARLRELAELKPKHDAVHARVVEMSEGEP